MATAEILDSSSLEIKVPATPAGTLSSAADQAANTLSPVATVAEKVAIVSDLVEQQMDIAEKTAIVHGRFMHVFPRNPLSTGIDGAAEVGEYADSVNKMIAIRQSRASAVLN